MRSYLDGGLTIETLGADAAAGPFRAEDARGAVAWLVCGEPYSYLHAVELNAPGVRRGFHVHPGHHENLYVFSGSLRLIASRGAERVDLSLAAGDLVGLAPGVAHGLIAETPALVVSFGRGSDPLADTLARPDLG